MTSKRYQITPENIRLRTWSSTYQNGSSTEERLLAGLERRGECLEWTGRTNDAGYGIVTIHGIRGMVRAHRVAWVLANGAIPDGMHVLHKCDNPRCCEPNHLFLGDHDANMKDMFAKGRDGTKKNRATGDRNGSRTKPESRPRGDRNTSRSRPESRPRGMDNR